MLLMGVITLFSLYFPLTSRPRLERAIKVAVAILAFAGFIVTQTRTGWLAVPIFILLGVALHFDYRRPLRAIAITAGILVVVVGIGASSDSLRDRKSTRLNS